MHPFSLQCVLYVGYIRFYCLAPASICHGGVLQRDATESVGPAGTDGETDSIPLSSVVFCNN